MPAEAVALQVIGAAVNQAAGEHTIHDLIARKASNPIVAHHTDLAPFAEFLGAIDVPQPPTATTLQITPAA